MDSELKNTKKDASKQYSKGIDSAFARNHEKLKQIFISHSSSNKMPYNEFVKFCKVSGPDGTAPPKPEKVYKI